MKTITKKMTFEQAMRASQVSGLIFLKYGLHCFGCAMAADETIEDGAKAHGLSDEQISEMISEINQKIKEQDKKK